MRQYKKNILDNKLTSKVMKNVTHEGRTRNIIFIIIALVIGYWLYHLWSAGRNAPMVTGAAPVNVSVAPVATEDLPNIVSLVGTVYAFETVAIKSRIDSQVTKVHFMDGDTVTEGAVLFELDDSILKAQLNQNEANLKRDEAQLENARTQNERYKKLAAKGFASNEKMQEAEAAYKTQIAAVNATKASIDSIKAQLDFTNITAPITGRAGTINVTRGNNVKANDTMPLVTINRVKPIRVQFAIPQRYYDALREAQKSNVEVTAQRSDGQDIAIGKLEYIDNAIDSTTGSFNARAVFENEDEKLWPGMFVNVSITLNIDNDAVVIPQVAVQNGQEGSFVFVIDEAAKKAIKRPIEILRTQDNKAVIKSGVILGEKVAVDGLLKLSDGAAVNVSDSSAPKEEKHLMNKK